MILTSLGARGDLSIVNLFVLSLNYRIEIVKHYSSVVKIEFLVTILLSLSGSTSFQEHEEITLGPNSLDTVILPKYMFKEC